jgi:hypothetical protein
MKIDNSQTALAHPKIFASLLAGFDTITTHILLIVFPLILDFTIWLGPHLQVKTLVQNIYEQMLRTPGLGITQPAESGQITTDFYKFVAEHFNLLSMLRSIPVGVPSLMSGDLPVLAPGWMPAFIDISSIFSVFMIAVGFSLIGLVMGTFYYIVVSQIVLAGKLNWKQALNQWPGAAVQVVGLALAWVFIFFIVSIPASCLISVFVIGGIPLGQLTLFFYSGFLIWVFFPLLFSAHGIIVYRQNLVASVRASVRMTRLSMPSVSFFFLLIFIISQVMDIIWRWPADDSWVTVVGILGHAFVSTGLLAASFIYYRDVNQWQQKTLGVAVPG